MTAVTHRPLDDPFAGLTPLEAGEIVDRLRATFASGRTKSLDWRIRQLEGIERLVSEREGEIAAALKSDLGRTSHEAWFGDIAPTVGESAYARKHLRRWMQPTRTSLPLSLLPGKGSYHYEPLGTVLVIGPWNYPVYLTLGPMIGGLAAGNCVVLKPSEYAPATSTLLASLIPHYLDADAVAVVEGAAEATQLLIDQRLDHIFFTGGTEIGRKVMQAAAPHLTPVTLELGGKSPVIVTEHADLDVAARRIAWVKLLNSGQTCIAPDYLLVEKSVRDDLVSKLRTTIAEFRTGEGPTQPIVNHRQLARLRSLLDPAPGDVVLGGTTNTGEGDLSLAPTIVVDPDPESDLMTGEIFGPILPVLTIGSLTEAIAFVNAREKPLAAYIFSNTKAEQDRVIAEVPSGATVVNHVAMHVLAPQLPFGGVGASGMGAYHGKWGYETFSHRKAVLVKRAKPDLKLLYPPYSERDKKIMRRLA